MKTKHFIFSLLALSLTCLPTACGGDDDTEEKKDDSVTVVIKDDGTTSNGSRFCSY